ncbi:MAG: DUF1570 domain-containing protein [Phycisphaerae bacterium]|nr:DUF1570 domain-containing protein [Phycisphaerae bacterium]
MGGIVALGGCAGDGGGPGVAPGMQPAASAPRSASVETVTAAPAAVAFDVPITVDPWVWNASWGPVEGKVISGPRYRVRTTKNDETLPRQLVRFYEGAIEHYTNGLVTLPLPSKPLETYLFATRDHWGDFTRTRMEGDADTYLALGRGGYTIEGEAVLYDLGRWDTLALAAHEGWHQYTQTVFRHPLPIWLEEGVATYMEGHRWSRGDERPAFNPWRNYERFGELREAVRENELIDLDELMAGIPQGFLKSGRSKLLTYYAQVWALTHYLVEGEGGRYRPALEELLHDAAEGRLAGKVAASSRLPAGRGGRTLGLKVGRAVAIVYFNPDFASFKAGYEAFVADITRRGAGDLVWKGQSPVSQPGADAVSPKPAEAAAKP